MPAISHVLCRCAALCRRAGLRGGALRGLALAWLLLSAGTALAQRATTANPDSIPGQRPGSAPMPPVRVISPDPTLPQGPPPPGTTNPGQHSTPGTSRKPVAGIPDSILVKQARQDSIKLAAKPKGPIETTVHYVAKDSIQFDVARKEAKLYNKADVNYGAMDLKAALITIDYAAHVMTAEGRRDSVKHRVVDKPVFKDAAGQYAAGRIAYNFQSKRGKITETVTQQGEGYVSAQSIKKAPNNDLFGVRGRYTTCNLEHPHFYIQASKMKVIPGDKVVTGPFNLVIGDVPTPLGFLFGFFPMPNKSRGSGVIIPTFGQAQDRGYYLSNGGYYFAPNDNIGVRLTGDIYAGNAQTFGGYGVTADVSYLKRYQYQGNFNFRYTNRPGIQILSTAALNTSLDYVKPAAAQTFWISWSHTPVARPGGGRFSASVQAGSSSYNRTNSLSSRAFLSPTFSSSVSYTKQLRYLPINYSLKLSQSQNTQTGVMAFTLPDVSVGVARQYPYQWFKLKARPFYDQISISYNLVAQNQITNTVAARSLDGSVPLLGGATTSSILPISFKNIGSLLRNAQNGVQHQFGISLGSYTYKFLHISPGVNYGETWYAQRLDYKYIDRAQAVRIDTIHQFSRAYSYSANLNLNTTFYGTLVRKGTHKIQALRHKVTPSLNFSYSPDLTHGSAFQLTDFGTVRDPLTGLQTGGLRTATGAFLDPRYYSRFQGSLYGAPSSGAVEQLSFSLQNAVEMKVRDDKDTTGNNPVKKVSLIDGLDFNGSYNFLADTLKLSPLSVSFRTQVARKLSLISNASFEAYQRDSSGRTINRYLFDQPGHRKLLRLSSASFTTSYAFNPVSGKKHSVVPRQVAPANDPTLGTVGPPAMYADYVDFDIPWELSLTYTAGYTTNAVPLQQRILDARLLPTSTVLVQSPFRSSLTATGSVKLTENLKLTYNTGYDFSSMQATITTISFFRDLHCWQVAGQWTPFGTYRGYNFTISAKSSLLQSLKYNRNRNVQYQ
ncbi:MAG: putative LPS assembly protein LptD [Janthinobacterium lividum]